MSLPADPGDLTPDDLTGLLRSGGLSKGRVTDLRWERIGQDRGFGGVRARVTARHFGIALPGESPGRPWVSLMPMVPGWSGSLPPCWTSP